MVVFLRYFFLMALGLGSALVLVNAMTATGLLLLSDAGDAPVEKSDISLLILMGLALAGFLSLMSFLVKAFPQMMSDWFENNKDRFATLLLGFLVCLVFVLV